MNRFYPLHVVTTDPGDTAPGCSFEDLFLSGGIPDFCVLPPGSAYAIVVPEPGGLRTFRARTSLGLVPVPFGCAP